MTIRYPDLVTTADRIVESDEAFASNLRHDRFDDEVVDGTGIVAKANYVAHTARVDSLMKVGVRVQVGKRAARKQVFGFTGPFLDQRQDGFHPPRSQVGFGAVLLARFC